MLGKLLQRPIFYPILIAGILFFLCTCNDKESQNRGTFRDAHYNNVREESDVQSWEKIEENSSDSLEAEGIMPADLPNMDNNAVSDLNELGDEGIKKSGKKDKNKKSNSQENEYSTGEETYFVIAGSFREEKNADLFVDSLKKMGYSAEKIQFEDTRLISVSAAKSETAKEAATTLEELKRIHKIPGYVLKKQD